MIGRIIKNELMQVRSGDKVTVEQWAIMKIITQKEQPHDKETPLLGICLEKTVIQKVSSFLNERENGKIPRTLSISSDSVHCNTIYRGQNIETSYMSINRVKLLIQEFIFNNHNKHRN